MTTANAMKIESRGRVSERTDLTTRTDREVLDACIQKDDAAWRELHRRFDKPMRIEAYKRLGARLVERLPSDYDDDIMGEFWLKLLVREMANLRSFDWEQSNGLYNWFTKLVCQCATDYAGMILDQPQFAPLKDAREVADEGGVLASGREPLRGSLSAHVRRFNARLAARAQQETRQRARDGRKRRRATAKGVRS